MPINGLTQGAVMCERLDRGKPATRVLIDFPLERGEGPGWMVAYCDTHAGQAGIAALMDSQAARRQRPGR